MRCAQAKAAECRAGVSAMPDAGTTPDAGAASQEGLSELPVAFTTSWTGLFLECAGLPPDFEAFD
jgi:hypothetical protein